MMTLSTYGALARALTADTGLDARLQHCFQILADDAPQLDLRLTIWPGGTGSPPRSWAPPSCSPTTSPRY